MKNFIGGNFWYSESKFSEKGGGYVYKVNNKVTIVVNGSGSVATVYLSDFSPEDYVGNTLDGFSVGASVLVYNHGDSNVNMGLTNNPFTDLGISSVSIEKKSVHVYTSIKSDNDLLKSLGIEFGDVKIKIISDISGKEKDRLVNLTIDKWKNPFGLRDAELSKISLTLEQIIGGEKDGWRKVTAQGKLKLKSEKTSYDFYGQQRFDKVKFPRGKAFGLSAKSLSLETIATFADSLPGTDKIDLKKVIDSLPLDQVVIEKKGDYIVQLATTKEVDFFGEEGPFFRAQGNAVFMKKWKMADVKVNFSKDDGVDLEASFSSPETGKLPMSGSADFFIKAKPNSANGKMYLAADLKTEDTTILGIGVEGVTLAKTKLGMRKSGLEVDVDLGCTPPMLKISASISGFNPAKLDTPVIGASDCFSSLLDKLSCSGDAFFSLSEGGSCWSCKGYSHDRWRKLDSDKVCYKDTEKKKAKGTYDYDTGSILKACEKGTFANFGETKCYKCKSGYRHNAAKKVGTSGVCYKPGTTSYKKAVKVS